MCSLSGWAERSVSCAGMVGMAVVFNCASLVSYISRHFTLTPGDIIFTGTPEGVISGYPKDKQVWLKPGDKITSTIEKLGEQVVTLG